MIFIVEPGATDAVSAKSLKPELLAIARMWPVDGWIATIALPCAWLAAARAARSARGLIVVVSRPGFGGMTTAWLRGTAWPAASSIRTDRPGRPMAAGAFWLSRPAMVVSPGSPEEDRGVPALSVTETPCGATTTVARCWPVVRLGATTSGCHWMTQPGG